jgi:hypothetical protein
MSGAERAEPPVVGKAPAAPGVDTGQLAPVPRRTPKGRLAAALAVAIIADGLSWIEVFPPGWFAVLALDVVTAIVLWLLLGRGLVLLLALLLEAVPGLGLFPFWTLAVLGSEALHAAMSGRLARLRGRGDAGESRT